MTKPAQLLFATCLLYKSWLQSKTCSSWLAKDEEITQDMATCAMAFRLLRLHGYDVASGKRGRSKVPVFCLVFGDTWSIFTYQPEKCCDADGLAQFSEESSFYDSVQGYLNDSEALQELYKASHVQIFEEEPVLESIGSWSAKLLKEQLCSNKISRSVDPGEVVSTVIQNIMPFVFNQ
jgi:hypothetical protein